MPKPQKAMDIKYLNIPNVCFSLTDESDEQEVHFKKQRLERGFDDSETWSLRDTIAQFIIPRLERYQQIAQDKLERDPALIAEIDCFLEAMKLITRYERIDDWNEQEIQAIQTGLDVFPKIFMSLWW